MAEYCECCEALGFDPHAGLEGGYCRGCGHWHGGPWPVASLCMACGSPDCPGLAGVDLCPRWQEAEARHARGEFLTLSGEYITPSADLPACRDEDPATPAVLAACYPDPPEYPHLEDD